MNGHTIIRAAVATFWLLAGMAFHTSPALAFPENVRHGYASCTSCHVSPTGGGALNAYGRGASTGFATWGSEKQATPFYGLVPLPKEIAVGGDSRTARLVAQPDGAPAAIYRTIPMQYDGELAVTPVEAITFAASWGVYGDEFQGGSRRHYVLARIGDHVTGRVGRFFPAYGLHTADHSTYARKALGFDEGGETVNGELGLHSSFGDAFVTAIYGVEANFSASKREGYDTDSNEPQGASVRLQAYLGQASLVGISCLVLESYDPEGDRRACGVHAVLAATSWLWATGDFNALLTEADYASTGAFSVEPFRGFTISLQVEGQREKRRAGLELKWFPVPHVDLTLIGRREQSAFGFVNSAVGMVHHYL